MVQRIYPPPPAPARATLLVNTDSRFVGLGIPQDGSSSHFEDMHRYFSEILNAIGNTYAPRRMVKIMPPDDPRGIPIVPTNSVSFKIPAQLAVPWRGCVPLLLYKAGQYSWRAPRLLQKDQNDVPGLLVSVALTPDVTILSYATVKITNNYEVQVAVRGALYFPEVSRETLALTNTRTY